MKLATDLANFLFIQMVQSHAGASPEPLSPAWEALYIMSVLLIYAMMVTLSSIVQVFDWKIGLITLMVLLMFVFIMGVCVSVMLLKQCFRSPAGKPIVAPAARHRRGRVWHSGSRQNTGRAVRTGQTMFEKSHL